MDGASRLAILNYASKGCFWKHAQTDDYAPAYRTAGFFSFSNYVNLRPSGFLLFFFGNPFLLPRRLIAQRVSSLLATTSTYRSAGLFSAGNLFLGLRQLTAHPAGFFSGFFFWAAPAHRPPSGFLFRVFSLGCVSLSPTQRVSLLVSLLGLRQLTAHPASFFSGFFSL